MAISRQNAVLTKLHALTVKAALTAVNVQLAVDNWENDEFPSKLERQVRAWMKAHGHEARHAGVIAAYAKLDEKSASVLVDPVTAAQDAIIKLKDEDDIHLLVKRAINYTEISNRLWTMIVAYSESLSARTLANLAQREDAPAKFVKEFGEADETSTPAKPARRSADKPLSARAQRRLEAEANAKRGRRGSEKVAEDEEEKPVRRSSRKLTEEKPVHRGRTGASKVVKPRVKEVPAEMDLDDDEDGEASVKKPIKSNRPSLLGKTVNKGHKVEGAIAKIRKVVGPAKTTVKRVQVEDRVDSARVKAAARVVRRPRA